MNRTILLAMLRQRLTSPVRLVLLVFVFALPLLFAALSRSLRGLADPFAFALVLGAGAIGQDLSSGVLQLTFARPVTRSGYVFGKWAAIALVSAILAWIQLALGALILSGRVEATSSELLRTAGESLLAATGIAGTVVLFSSLFPGLGDLALFMVVGIGGQVIRFVGDTGARLFHRESIPLLIRIGDELGRLVSPHADLSFAPGSLYALAALLSNLALCLTIAIAVMNRRELSYASG